MDINNATYIRNSSVHRRKSEVTTSKRTKFGPLPTSVINHSKIKTFVFFIGLARSGHSIVAAVLDSHPHIVISNELDVFNNVLNHPKVNRSFLFNQIWHTSYERATTVDDSVDLHSTSKGYSLAIDGLYQGSYQSYINVIGDKIGGTTTKTFLANPKLFKSRLNQLHALNLTIKVFHVIRNPYDNIATMVMYRHCKYQTSEVAKIKNSTITLNVGHELVDKVIDYYFDLYKASEEMRWQFKLDVMDVHGKDLITNPRVTISKMCTFLQVSCSHDYLDTVSRKIFGSESKTRYKLKWTDDQILKVKQNIGEFSNLRQYSNFDS